MFNQIYPVLMGTGNLPPTLLSLVIEKVTNRSGATAMALNQVVVFDMFGTATESQSGSKAIWNTANTFTESDGRVTGGSVFANAVHIPQSTALMKVGAAGIFGVVSKLYSAGVDNTFVDLTVIGEVNLVKASATHAIGATYKVLTTSAVPATNSAGPIITADVLTGDKIVAIALTAGTTTTALNAFFNGFGFGQN